MQNTSSILPLAAVKKLDTDQATGFKNLMIAGYEKKFRMSKLDNQEFGDRG